MRRYLSAFALLALSITACRDDTPSKIVDLKKSDGPADLAMSVDLAKDIVETTINNIDTGVTPSGTRVAVRGVIVTGPARFEGTTKAGKCEYSTFVQDPNGPAPSGIKLYLTGQQCTQPDGGGTCRCPFAPNSGTPVDNVVVGDKVDVVGKADVYLPPVPDGGTLPIQQHEIVVTDGSITKNGTGAITPVVVTDPKAFALNGTGYKDYECMLVTVKPAQKAMVSTPDQYGAFTFGGAQFAGLYRFIYGRDADGGTFPAPNSSWTSITGIAQPTFGGGIAPRDAKDFTP